MNIIPQDEQQRMAAVKRYDILDTPPDGAFDRITAIAARRFKTPISIISVVDHDRIWFKSGHGAPVNQIPRDPGLCASAILTPDAYVLTDARVDPRSMTNPLVAGEMGLRFYAGAPLRTHDGYNLGTLCVLDTEPRVIDQDQIDDLRDLASVVMDQLELRRSARIAIEHSSLMAREIDHRVMNSLQFISSMLMMQSRGCDAADAASQLKMAANRVAAVAQVHRNFYSDAAGDVECLAFLRRLCADLSSILEKEIIVSGEPVIVPSVQIQPIGLLVNELVTNAAKHGQGKIDVLLEVAGGQCELSVCDEGPGLAGDYDTTSSPTGLGMKVVKALSQQLNGQMSAKSATSGAGSCFKVLFPKSEA
jgi:two-component sensor histidine kinase